MAVMVRTAGLSCGVVLLLGCSAPSAEEPRRIESAFHRVSDVSAERERAGRDYLEFIEVPSLSTGLYELAAGAEDRQGPHARDEVYYVIEGRAMLRVGDSVRPVGTGSVIYVAAGVPHRFERIARDLKVLVFFAAIGTE